MNRNAENHFALVPTIEAPRSIFDRSNQIKTSFNNGELIPVEVWQDVMPGDTVKIDTATIVRMTSALKTPVMDNAYCDIFYFFVPDRLTWEHFEEFMGANDDPWAQPTEYLRPTIKSPVGGWQQGTLADYFGIPTGKECEVVRKAFEAYAKIVNDHFRDQNSEYACELDKSDATLQGTNGSNYVTDIHLGGKPYKVNRFHDYFSSCLPAPYKTTTPVTIPLGNTAPVTISAKTGAANEALTLKGVESGIRVGINVNNNEIIQQGSGRPAGLYAYSWNQNPGAAGELYKYNDGLQGTADLRNATSATIDQLYQAMAVNKLYWIDGVHGTRFNELIYGHFKIKSPDQRVQRAEYLGGKRFSLNIDQVTQTSSNTTDQKLGSLAAYSQTADKDESFTYSATEFGTIMCLMCVRTERSYQQGLGREWFLRERTDTYFPVLANLSEMAVFNKEIYLSGNETKDNGVFGYQEAWAHLRYKPSRVSGQMRSNANGSLDTWHYADYYEDTPVLSPEWLFESTENMDRTLAVESEVSNQIIADIYFDSKWTREMPLYSIPGLPA